LIAVKVDLQNEDIEEEKIMGGKSKKGVRKREKRASEKRVTTGTKRTRLKVQGGGEKPWLGHC